LFQDFSEVGGMPTCHPNRRSGRVRVPSGPQKALIFSGLFVFIEMAVTFQKIIFVDWSSIQSAKNKKMPDKICIRHFYFYILSKYLLKKA
jgi:hypothetical protein